MLNGTLLPAHARHLVEEHVQQTFFWSSVFVGAVIPLHHTTVNDEPVLVHHRFEGVNDSVFFADVGPDLFYVDGLLGLLQVLLEEFGDDTVSEVGLDKELGNIETLTPTKDVKKCIVAIAIAIRSYFVNVEKPIPLTHIHGCCFISTATTGVNGADGFGVRTPLALKDHGRIEVITGKTNSR